ncbi:hypothetical protein NEAUS04_2005 [Nematocida ausubeli]|nr:hypothetical protein NEAUS04_2005 [Nematocida ausubeli]
MAHRNRNAAMFDELVQKYQARDAGRKKTDGGLEGAKREMLCYSHILGVCPRGELKQNHKSMCTFQHVPLAIEEDGRNEFLNIFNAPLQRKKFFRTRHLMHKCIVRLKDEIKGIMASLPKLQRQASTQAIAQYNQAKAEWAIFKLNGQEELEELALARLRKLEETNSREGVARMRCKACPHYLPWLESERKQHYIGKVHQTYIRMQQFLQNYYSQGHNT